MEAAHPLASLAPRDVVSRAIRHELATSGEPCVFLDLSSMPEGFARERFPQHLRALPRPWSQHRARADPRRAGGSFRMRRRPHRPFGPHQHREPSRRGETACTGLHGANRLASTSLLERLTARPSPREAHSSISPSGNSAARPRPWESPTRKADPVLIRQDMLQIQHTWNYAGVVPSRGASPRPADPPGASRGDPEPLPWLRATRDLIELRNAVQTALLVVHAAALSREQGLPLRGPDG